MGRWMWVNPEQMSPEQVTAAREPAYVMYQSRVNTLSIDQLLSYVSTRSKNISVIHSSPLSKVRQAKAVDGDLSLITHEQITRARKRPASSKPVFQVRVN